MSLHEGFFIFSRKSFHGAVHVFIHNVLLLDPTFFTGGVAHTQPPFVLAALQHIERVAVLHVADFVVDVGHAVAQRDLLRGNIDFFSGSRVVLATGD